MQDSRIEWTDDTVNPWHGCQKVSRACHHCYAESLDARWHPDEKHWGPTSTRMIRIDKAVAELDRIAKRSDKEGRPRRVFIASMADVFEDRADLVEPRKRLWDALFRLNGRLIPMLLTKRPEVMAAWAKEHGWPTSAWAMTTVEDQATAEERIPELLQVPALVHGVSCEPLVGSLDIGRWTGWECVHEDAGYESDTNALICRKCDESNFLSWVIAGGESGPHAQPSHPDWFRGLRDQCVVAGVPFFFKQWGEHRPAERGEWGPGATILAYDGRRIAPHERVDPVQGDRVTVRVGKKAAGRLLDGVEHSEVPDAR